MIVLIGGVAKSGKTTLAKQLLKEEQLAYFSTDYLMMSFVKGNPSLGIHADDDDFVVAKSLEPYLLGMIETMVHNRLNYCIEGVHLYPDFGLQMTHLFPNDVLYICLGYANSSIEEKKKELIDTMDLNENPWYRTYSNQEMDRLVLYLIQESNKLRIRCDELGLPYFEIQRIQEILPQLMKFVRVHLGSVLDICSQ